MQTVIIDNYDSFTYNLVHLVNEIIKKDVLVMRNDEVDYEILDKALTIILSPGPGIPEEAGDLKYIIKKYFRIKPMLGVCLGHQAMGEVFGSKLINLNNVFHGKKTLINQTNFESPIFKDVPQTFYAGRYHSWVIDNNSHTKEFQITAVDETGEIMAIQHKQYKAYGVQFHPESIMTEFGKQMLTNFINIR